MKKIFLDFDGTIVNSVKKIVQLYNERFQKQAEWTKVNKWNFTDQCPEIESSIKSFFASDEFYEDLELYDFNTLRVFNLLKNKYEVIICTIGCVDNVAKKSQWIKKNLKHENIILLAKDNNIMDKSIIDMSGGIIIDDHENNLFTSNADIKINFGLKREWNQNWSGLACSNWQELESLLL
ncbi:MAG TPA: hypothetical protein GXZ90_10170 [Clostridiales bacterium]|nr:hypothetical protein [Clostridiales bacterium]